MDIIYVCDVDIIYVCLPRDELPYRLTLPVAILHARSSHQLASLAMLGQGGKTCMYN